MAYTGRVPGERGIFFGLKVRKSVGILQVKSTEICYLGMSSTGIFKGM